MANDEVLKTRLFTKKLGIYSCKEETHPLDFKGIVGGFYYVSKYDIYQVQPVPQNMFIDNVAYCRR